MECLLCANKDVNIVEAINKNNYIRLWIENDINIYDELKTSIIYKFYCPECGLFFFDPINAGGDVFYSKLAEYDWYYSHSGKTEFDYVQRIIKENDNVLDIGAGRGELFKKTNTKIVYTGLELSTKAVELAAQSSINVINEDLLIHSEMNVEKYDVICIFQVLEHITEIELFFKSVIKCLKTDGKICLAVPNNDGFLSFVTNGEYNLPPHHTIMWNYKSLMKLGQLYNLDIIDVHYEKLQDVHKEWFVTEYSLKLITTLFRIKHKSVNFSFLFQFCVLLNNKLLKFSVLRRLFTKIILFKSQRGHSVIVTLQKKH